MNFEQILLIATFVEALIQTVKPIYDKEKGWNIDIIVALVLGVAVCLVTGIDLFTVVGLDPVVPYVGSVLTGILISRGANVAHELIALIQNTADAVLRK